MVLPLSACPGEILSDHNISNVLGHDMNSLAQTFTWVLQFSPSRWVTTLSMAVWFHSSEEETLEKQPEVPC